MANFNDNKPPIDGVPQGQNVPKTEAQKSGALLAGALKALGENWLMQTELIAHKARVCFTKYEAAKAEGFTDREALDICTRTWDL